MGSPALVHPRVESRVWCRPFRSNRAISSLKLYHYLDVSYGPKALALLRAGLSPAAIVKAVLDSDPDPRPADWSKDGRQFAVMDAKGRYAGLYRSQGDGMVGQKGGAYCTAQGNILAGEGVVTAMVEAFEKSQGHLDAPDGGARRGPGGWRR